jgi:hypothetical protein
MDANFGIGTLAWGRKGVIRAGMAREGESRRKPFGRY